MPELEPSKAKVQAILAKARARAKALVVAARAKGSELIRAARTKTTGKPAGKSSRTPVKALSPERLERLSERIYAKAEALAAKNWGANDLTVRELREALPKIPAKHFDDAMLKLAANKSVWLQEDKVVGRGGYAHLPDAGAIQYKGKLHRAFYLLRDLP